MSYKPTLYLPLHVQQPEAIQRGLFAASIEPEEIELECDHAVTEPQASLFGGTDEVCVTCGATVTT